MSQRYKNVKFACWQIRSCKNCWFRMGSKIRRLIWWKCNIVKTRALEKRELILSFKKIWRVLSHFSSGNLIVRACNIFNTLLDIMLPNYCKHMREEMAATMERRLIYFRWECAYLCYCMQVHRFGRPVIVILITKSF